VIDIAVENKSQRAKKKTQRKRTIETIKSGNAHIFNRQPLKTYTTAKKKTIIKTTMRKKNFNIHFRLKHT